jgi:hypothetical protein
VADIPSGSAAPDGCRAESLRWAKRLCGPFGNMGDGAPVNPRPPSALRRVVAELDAHIAEVEASVAVLKALLAGDEVPGEEENPG